MLLDTIHCIIDRRVLLNYHIDPAVLGRVLPPPFQPKLYGNHGVGGVCMIRFKQLRPRLAPAGLASDQRTPLIVSLFNGGRMVNLRKVLSFLVATLIRGSTRRSEDMSFPASSSEAVSRRENLRPTSRFVLCALMAGRKSPLWAIRPGSYRTPASFHRWMQPQVSSPWARQATRQPGEKGIIMAWSCAP